MTASPIAIARTLHAALEAGHHGNALRRHFTEDAKTIEHPNAIEGTVWFAHFLNPGKYRGTHPTLKRIIGLNFAFSH